MNCPSYRSEFVHYASDAWLHETLHRWHEEGIPESTPWFWVRDVFEVLMERGIITTSISPDAHGFIDWRMLARDRSLYTVREQPQHGRH